MPYLFNYQRIICRFEPAKGLIHINGHLDSLDSIQIFDVAGRLVYQSVNPSNNTIPIGHLSSGLYVVSFTTNQGLEIRKLMINK